MLLLHGLCSTPEELRPVRTALLALGHAVFAPRIDGYSFDPERKLRFNTYARWWVRAQMQRALESGGRLVRMPGSAVEDLRRLHTAARELRAMGGYAKDSTPFTEFLWADFLRPRIKPKAIKADFADALTKALVMAKTPEADYLPGWSGPHTYMQRASAKAKGRKGKGKTARSASQASE